jgi:hypothetical protein
MKDDGARGVLERLLQRAAGRLPTVQRRRAQPFEDGWEGLAAAPEAPPQAAPARAATTAATPAVPVSAPRPVPAPATTPTPAPAVARAGPAAEAPAAARHMPAAASPTPAVPTAPLAAARPVVPAPLEAAPAQRAAYPQPAAAPARAGPPGPPGPTGSPAPTRPIGLVDVGSARARNGRQPATSTGTEPLRPATMPARAEPPLAGRAPGADQAALRPPAAATLARAAARTAPAPAARPAQAAARRAAEPAAEPAARARPPLRPSATHTVALAAAAPTVSVHIGTVEIRAMPPATGLRAVASAAAPPAASRGADGSRPMPLEDYLAQVRRTPR